MKPVRRIAGRRFDVDRVAELARLRRADAGSRLPGAGRRRRRSLRSGRPSRPCPRCRRRTASPRRSTMATVFPAKPAAVSLKRKWTRSLTKTMSSTSRSLSFRSRAGRSLPTPTRSSGTPLRRAYAAASSSPGPSVLMPSVASTMATGVVPRSSSSAPRTAAPRRVLSPLASAAFNSFDECPAHPSARLSFMSLR